MLPSIAILYLAKSSHSVCCVAEGQLLMQKGICTAFLSDNGSGWPNRQTDHWWKQNTDDEPSHPPHASAQAQASPGSAEVPHSKRGSQPRHHRLLPPPYSYTRVLRLHPPTGNGTGMVSPCPKKYTFLNVYTVLFLNLLPFKIKETTFQSSTGQPGHETNPSHWDWHPISHASDVSPQKPWSVFYTYICASYSAKILALASRAFALALSRHTGEYIQAIIPTPLEIAYNKPQPSILLHLNPNPH